MKEAVFFDQMEDLRTLGQIFCAASPALGLALRLGHLTLLAGITSCRAETSCKTDAATTLVPPYRRLPWAADVVVRIHFCWSLYRFFVSQSAPLIYGVIEDQPKVHDT